METLAIIDELISEWQWIIAIVAALHLWDFFFGKGQK